MPASSAAKKSPRAARKPSAPRAGKSRSKKASPKQPKLFSRVFRFLACLLALYGIHSAAMRYLPGYREKATPVLAQLQLWCGKSIDAAQQKLSAEGDYPPLLIANRDAAQQSPYDNLTLGVPRFSGLTVVDRRGYAIGYSEPHLQPLWVSYRLTQPEVQSKFAKRSDDFRHDDFLSVKSAELGDYKGSHYDRGHLAPAADMSFSVQAMSESFLLSNMSPQVPEVNRKVWKDLEEKVRDFAVSNQEIYVVTGPVFSSKTPSITIGKNKIPVPDAYYKVIYDSSEPTHKAIGFLVPNTANQEARPLSAYAVSVDTVEAATQLDFFSELPDEEERKVERECRYRDWE